MRFTYITEYDKLQGDYIPMEKILINLDKVSHGIHINEEVLALYFGGNRMMLVSRKEFNDNVFPED